MTETKVLLIDDDFAILDGVSDFLEGEGYRVVPASNGIDALNQLRSGVRVDAIVLDVMMPMMDGWDFRAEQLADPSLRDIPVVVMSACGFARESLQHQFNTREVLPKPLDLDGFLQALHAACTKAVGAHDDLGAGVRRDAAGAAGVRGGPVGGR